MKKLVNEKFRKALYDYWYLLENGYPRKEINRLVGNRFELSRMQRSAMHRGLAIKTDIDKRQIKRTQEINNKKISIDAFNVFYTISNYLCGRVVFLSQDGFLRDTGEVTGRNQASPLFMKAIQDVVKLLVESNIAEVYFLFDSPVSHSGSLAHTINGLLKDNSVKGRAYTEKFVDVKLKKMNNGVVATSDSAILDHTGAEIFDLARSVIDTFYKGGYVRIEGLLNGK